MRVQGIAKVTEDMIQSFLQAADSAVINLSTSQNRKIVPPVVSSEIK